MVLPAPFGPDEADLLAPLEGGGGLDEDDLAAVLLADFFEADHGVRITGSRRFGRVLGPYGMRAPRGSAPGTRPVSSKGSTPMVLAPKTR